MTRPLRLFDKLIARVDHEQNMCEDQTLSVADREKHIVRARAFLEAAQIVAEHLKNV